MKIRITQPSTDSNLCLVYRYKSYIQTVSKNQVGRKLAFIEEKRIIDFQTACVLFLLFLLLR